MEMLKGLAPLHVEVSLKGRLFRKYFHEIHSSSNSHAMMGIDVVDQGKKLLGECAIHICTSDAKRVYPHCQTKKHAGNDSRAI